MAAFLGGRMIGSVVYQFNTPTVVYICHAYVTHSQRRRKVFRRILRRLATREAKGCTFTGNFLESWLRDYVAGFRS